MGLDYRQKNYIKRNIKRLPVAEIAAVLGISESEILNYLKKRWPSDKYEKFLRKKEAAESVAEQTIQSFSFSNFVRENRFILLGLTLLVLAVYFNSFFNGFTSDDVQGYALDPEMGKFSRLFTGIFHFSLQNLFRDIAYQIGGLHPFSFRIINIFFHLNSTILIFSILSLISNKRIALIAASLFAVHPILIESVGWISGAPYSQSAFFFLLSFLFYLLSKSNRKYLYYSIVFFILSILSSEKAIALFLVFIAYDVFYQGVKLSWKKVVPFMIIGLAVATIFISKIGSRIRSVEQLSYQQSQGFDNPLVQVPIAIVSYLHLIFWPDKLTLYHTEMNFSRGQFVVVYIFFLAFLGILIYTFRKNKKAFFWLIFFIIALSPTLTPFRISWTVAERYVYLGSLGIFVAFAMLADRAARFSENAKMLVYAALVIAITGLSVRTIVRNRDWKSEDTLWFATARVAPSSQSIHNNLGDVYARNGDLQKAAEEFKMAIQINPNYADAYHNLGNTYQRMGNNEEAMKAYQTAAQINPKLWQSYQNMASIYFDQGNYEAAYENAKKALEINPQDPNLQENLKIVEKKLEK